MRKAAIWGLTLLLVVIAALLHRKSTQRAMASSSTTLLKTLVVPAASGKASASVIFAHGLGDSGLGWIDVARMLSARPALKHVRFILPNAPVQPVTLNMGMSMPSWFDITTLEDVTDAEDEKGLLQSAGEIKKLVQAEASNEGISSDRVVVGGFSQILRTVQRRGSELLGAIRGTEEWKRCDYGSGPSSSIHGVGVDILFRPRLAQLLDRRGRLPSHPSDRGAALDHFSRRILSKAERGNLEKLRTDGASEEQLHSWLAVRWTAKEAAYKALYPSPRVRWTDLSVTKSLGGLKPQLSFSEESGLQEQGPKLHLSVSHDGDYGGAISYLAGLSSAQPVAGIVGLSTWLPLRSKISSMLQPHSASIPIFHGHGSSDPIVQYEYGTRTVDFVKKDLGAGEFTAGPKPRGVRFETYRGMQHSACPEEIEHVGQFLESVIPASS